MKKKVFALLALAMSLCLAACGGGSEEETQAAAENSAEASAEETGELPKKACYITQYGLSAPFTAMCWEGVESLEEEGWEVQCLEVAETTEFADQIRAMAAEGYTVIVVEFDARAEVAVQLADELDGLRGFVAGR